MPILPTKKTTPLRKTARWLVLMLALACLLTACSGTHDALYDDADAIAGDDLFDVKTFIGKQTDPNAYEFTCGAISGSRTLWQNVTTAGREITIHAQLNETGGGDIKLVLVDPYGGVITILETSKEHRQVAYTFTTQPGPYYIKVVARGPAKAGASIELDGITGIFG